MSDVTKLGRKSDSKTKLLNTQVKLLWRKYIQTNLLSTFEMINWSIWCKFLETKSINIWNDYVSLGLKVPDMAWLLMDGNDPN